MPLLPIEQARAQAHELMNANILPDEQEESPEQKRQQEIANWIFAYCVRVQGLGGKRINYQHAVWRATTNVARSEALRT